MTNNTLTELAEQLNKANTVAVVCHIRPDGDALGSGLALVQALKDAGKTATMLCEDLPSSKFSFIPEMQQVKTTFPAGGVDLFVSVDCADVSRMGCFYEQYLKPKQLTLNIDHHVSNNRYAKYNYVVDCPATCELIPEVLDAAGFPITPQIAQLLMLGLMTDSGNFVHKDVSAKTFEVAARLRALNADVTTISYEMFSRQPKARALLYGRVMSKMRFALDDCLAMVCITQKDMHEIGDDKSLTEGFVDFPLTIDGVEVAASLLEMKPNQYKVSLRSKGKVNVNAVASTFGGGGHILASGCMLFGEYEEVVERLTYAVYQNL